ncbi:NADPH:quinone oxidoreductase family protein [Aliiroseovarius sp. PTFE2010]|uniref:NADPH:quinone oxidoreductase family protein n=1 Tax=Aliiroseovarius sp. PTFE2010 TaxID=3417190 RepID=UPI003CF34213
MKAFQVSSYDIAPALVDVDTPEPGKDEVLLKTAACGLNFADFLLAKGQYQEKPPLPFTLGSEAAGTIQAVGDGVTSLKPGDRVATMGGSGGLAQYGVFAADTCFKIPDAMSFEDAAAFQIAYGTSHVALDYKANLQPGENLLVLGAAGGVGLTAIEIGKLMGANVIACARGQDKLEVCRKMGADHLIDSETDDIRAAVKAAGGADVVYDAVGGDQFKAAFRAVNPEARILVIGFASGDIPQIPANHLLVKNVSVIGHYWGGYRVFKPSVITDSMEKLFDWYSAGKLHPHISFTFPLSDTAQALDTLRTRKSTGKVVVTID